MGVGAKSDSRSFVGHPDYELPFKRNYQPALIPHTEQMGVHGLTTFLRENRRALSRSETFSSASGSERDSYTPFVVDGWSLIYALYTDSGLPWVYGGEYEAFAKYVQDIAKAWLAVGLEPYFVFDGPTPLAKIPTTLKRLVDTNIHNANIFFRTSAAAHSTPSFLASTRIIPPLLLETCLDALEELRASNSRVHVLMADGEADPFCVSLAGALGGGLVVGLDSDFSVLSAEGYGGYIPLDEMVWQSSPTADEVSPNQAAEDDDGFTAVVTKPRTKRKSSGLIPPSGSDLSLNVTVYHPRTLAERLRLPPALLPLFSALVGNDFSNPQNTKKFFENRSTPAERIWKVARSVVAATKKSQSGTQTPSQGRGDAVLDVIHSAVSQLLVRPDLIGSGEVDKIVDETIVAALECTIPALQRSYSPTDLCPLHPEDECPLISSLGENGTSLVKAYRAGRVHVRVLGAVTTGIVLPKQFLEDPDQKACTMVTNNIWTWIWAILGAGGHVSASSPTEDNTTTGDDGTETESRAEDDSELISVVDDFTATEPSVCSEDLASELKERLKGLAGSWDEDTEGIKSDKAPGKSLAQYVRRGLKLVPEPVTLQPVSELSTDRFPDDGAQYWTRHDRILAFLEGTKSNTQALQDAFKVSSVDPGVLLWVCALRCVVQSSAEGANGGSGSPAVVGRWKKNEARALLAALVNSDSSTSSDATPPLDTRTIQRIAQVLYAFDAGARLAEVVYLFEEKGDDGVEKPSGRDVVGRAVRLFSGRAVHAAASILPEVDDHVWGLVCDGLEEDVWAHEPRAEKVKIKAKKKSKAKTDGNGNGAGKGHGFNLLASLGTE